MISNLQLLVRARYVEPIQTSVCCNVLSYKNNRFVKYKKVNGKGVFYGTGSASGKAIWSCNGYWVFGDTFNAVPVRPYETCSAYKFHRSSSVCPIIPRFAGELFDITCFEENQQLTARSQTYRTPEIATTSTTSTTSTENQINTKPTTSTTSSNLPTQACCSVITLTGYIFGTTICTRSTVRLSSGKFAYACKTNDKMPSEFSWPSSRPTFNFFPITIAYIDFMQKWFILRNTEVKSLENISRIQYIGNPAKPKLNWRCPQIGLELLIYIVNINTNWFFVIIDV